MLLSWITVSSSTKAKCVMPGETRRSCPPAGHEFLLLSAFSPIPRRNVPEMTVAISGCGCLYGGTTYPLGNLMWNQNIPLLSRIAVEHRHLGAWQMAARAPI